MLKQRVITAVIMLAILLPALFYKSPTPFCAIALILIAAAGWEWGRLNACSEMVSWLLGLLLIFLCGLTWSAGLLVKPMPMLWIISGSAWVLVGSLLLRRGVAGWSGLAKSDRKSVV